MKLILHIGTAKTGTTTLQNWFYLNRKVLMSQGVYYPKALGIKNHINLSSLAIGSDKNGNSIFQKKNGINYAEFTSKLMGKFDDEYNANSEIKNWIISNEHMHSRLTSVEMVERVKAFLGDKFENIK